mgnify:CR=1 FL=1
MPKILILGAGGIGLPIASALKREEYNLVLSDYSQIAIDKAKEYFFNMMFDTQCSLDFHVGDATEYLNDNKESFDIVVSALPYHMNKDIASGCIYDGIPYVDLGGHVDTTNQIREHTEKNASAPVASDQGLAPGLVNICAEEAFEAVKENKYRSAKIKMAVGGLPENRGLNPLDYIVTWSVDGLINEYEGEADILEGAERKRVPTLTGLETMTVDGDELEAFYTSGGSAHTIESMFNQTSRPIPDVTYKTLRYPGHMKIVKWLMEQVEFRRLDMMDLFRYGCKAGDEKDIVKFYVNATNGNLSYTREHTFYASEDFSAMQRSTAYSAAAAIQTLLRGVNSAPNRAWMKCAIDYSYFNQSFFHERFRDALNRDRPEKEKEWVV